ncbi:MAG: MFS transporter [Clostridia bacterium]|nr:MFS transporter [Clostridia bacterium]
MGQALKTEKYVKKNEMTAFCVAGLGQGMIYALMSSYISDYYLNVLQLTPMFVLLLMLLARVWDAINDPLMGMIVDRSNLKSGKMIPFIRMAIIPVAIMTLLMYLSPNLGSTEIMVYSAIVYVLWGMLYTVGDVAFWGLPNVMTPSSEERSSVISVSKIFNSIGSAVPEVLFLVIGLILAKVVETSANPIDPLTIQKRKYLIMAIVTVAIGSILYSRACFGVKERVKMPVTRRKKGEPSLLKRVFTCKPLLLVLLMGVLSSGRYMVSAAAIHVARYSFYIGPDLATLADDAARSAAIEASISTVKTVFQISSIVGLFGATLFMPKLMKKFDYKKLVIVSCLAGFAASIVTTIVGWFTMNLYACIPFIIISCIPLGVINTVCFAMICDCLDYMELKTGFRDNALGAACQGFINKIGNAFATSGIVIMYMVIGLKPDQMLSSEAVVAATELAPSLRFAMFTLVSIVPGISMLLCSIPMFFYKIAGKEKERIVSELAIKRKERGIDISNEV